MFLATLALTFALLTPPTRAGWETNGPAYPLVDVVTAGGDDDTVYAGARDAQTGTSALFRSRDGGGHWELLVQAPPGETIRQLAVDPTDARRLLALTIEEGATRFYRSDDSGLSWRLQSALDGSSVEDDQLFFDPAREDTAYVVRGKELFRSAHGGPWVKVSGFASAWSAWSAPGGILFWTAEYCTHIPCYPQFRFEYLFAVDDGGEVRYRPPCLRLLAVAYDPFNSSVAYAAGPDCADLLKSLDGGRTWQGWDPSGDLERLLHEDSDRTLTQLAFNPRTDSVIYGLMKADHASGRGELLESRDAAESWELLPPPNDAGVSSFTVGKAGSLYVGTGSGVFRLGPHTRIVEPRAN